MFVPLHDANNLKHIRQQYVTIGLIMANLAMFLIASLGSRQFAVVMQFGIGYIPAVANNYARLPSELDLFPEYATYVTYAFLHANWMHLGGNMLFLWVFGDNVEDALGHFRFLVFYLLCAAAGAWFHGIVLPFSEAPLIGASGAIAGIVAAYLLLHPHVKVWVLAFGRIPLRIPALILLVLWIGMQFWMLAMNDDGDISWASHVGGIIAGSILVLVLRRPGVLLLDRLPVPPPAPENLTVPSTSIRPTRNQRWGRQ